MMFGRSDWRGSLSPAQFNLRVAILGGFAVVILSVIFFRLWYLEVLSGDRYLAEANNNQVREVTVQAPRGSILDRDGKTLVDNRTALALQVRTTELPESERKANDVIERLAGVTRMSVDGIEKAIRQQTKESPASPVTLQRDVPYDLVYYLRENQGDFPGVSVDRVYVRRYPQGDLAAHLLGYVREVNEEQLEEPQYQALEPGDGVGQAGVEYQYDNLVRGINGLTRVQVDATGAPTGGRLSTQQSRTGNNLRLTLDSELQATAETAVSRFGLPGGFVAMDVRTGQILALGSVPSFDPSVFAKPVIPPAEADAIFEGGEGTEAPIFNRAIQGGYPTGSTFKLVTAIGALEEGLVTADEIINDGGSIEVGDITFRNAGDVAHGPVDMRTALKVSSDVYFYTQGLRDGATGDSIQTWAKQLGLGSLTGIDLPAEAEGLVPTPEWRNDLYREGLTDRPWSVGDNINLAVGQGDLQASPLQLAVAYAAVANGGTIVRPHVGMQVEDPSGRVIQEISPAPRREIDIDPAYTKAVMEGLHTAAMEPGGTSYPIFGGFPVEIAGKTGTAERGFTVNGTTTVADQSWYAAVAPFNDPEIVVAATIERGGFGADAAAPAVAEILTDYFDIKPGQVEQVSDPTAVYE